MAWTVPWNLIAMGLSGDVGDFTVYTDRFMRKVVFPRSPPKVPSSELQLAWRAKFKNAQASWNLLSTQEKENLENACRRTSSSLTGQNLWISCSLKLDNGSLNTLEKQSGLPLPRP